MGRAGPYSGWPIIFAPLFLFLFLIHIPNFLLGLLSLALTPHLTRRCETRECEEETKVQFWGLAVKNRTHTMGKKRGTSYQKKDAKSSKSKTSSRHGAYSSDDMDDDIDTCNTISFFFYSFPFSSLIFRYYLFYYDQHYMLIFLWFLAWLLPTHLCDALVLQFISRGTLSPLT